MKYQVSEEMFENGESGWLVLYCPDCDTSFDILHPAIEIAHIERVVVCGYPAIYLFVCPQNHLVESPVRWLSRAALQAELEKAAELAARVREEDTFFAAEAQQVETEIDESFE
jgi:hypothetical protein